MLQRLENPVYWLAILSGLKLILNACGVDIITDNQINNIANGVAAIIAVIALVWTQYINAQLTKQIGVLKQGQ